jgi:hypothetical protein
LVWQTDGRPMSGDIGTGATRAAVKLSQKVLAAGLPGYVQLAGGTNNHTIAKLKAVGLLNGWGISNEQWDMTEEGSFPTLNSRLPTPQSQPFVAGVAYGSYARVLLSPILDKLETIHGAEVDASLVLHQNPSSGHLEAQPTLLWQAVASAQALVSQLKSAKKLPQAIPN